MGLNSSGYTETVELTAGKTAQQVDIQGTTPGSENPQTGSVAIKAKKGNTGPLFIGFSKAEVEATEAGFELAAGETISIDIGTLGKMWFNGANTKDKLCILGIGP